MKSQEESWDFRKKIDKILNTNSLNINSVYGLEKYLGLSMGSIAKFYNENREPGLRVIKKMKTTFNWPDDYWDDMHLYKSAGKGTDDRKEFSIVEEEAVAYRRAMEALVDTKDEIIELQKREIKRLEEELRKLRADA